METPLSLRAAALVEEGVALLSGDGYEVDIRRRDLKAEVPPTLARHFVIGHDKQGTLWDFKGSSYLSSELGVRTVTDLVFLPPTQNINNKVLGGMVVHGGASAAVIDAFAAGVGIHLLDFDFSAATATQSFRYRRPLFVGTSYSLVVTALQNEVVKGVSSVVRSAFVDSKGVECIISETTMRVPRKKRMAKKNGAKSEAKKRSTPRSKY